MINIQTLLKTAIKASVKAGEKILYIYNSNEFEIQIKSDNSPLTIADSEANKIITTLLEETNLPVMTEENKITPYDIRCNWEYYWLVDPLDGTKEFIKKNGEFTVNIALIYKNQPILGVIYVPVTDELYFSTEAIGAYKTDNVKRRFTNINLNELINISTKLPLTNKGRNYTIIGSRSHANAKSDKFLNDLKSKYGEIDIVSKGSSLKFCIMAEGLADFYPRFHPTNEWDTAAGHAIAVAAGCVVANANGSPLEYNKPDLLNPWFIVKSNLYYPY